MNSLSVEIENLCEQQLETLIFSTGGSKPVVIFQGAIECQAFLKKNLGYTFAEITISISKNQRKIVHWEVNLDQIHLNGNSFMINQHTQITEFKRNFDDCTIKLEIKKSSKSYKQIHSDEKQNEKILEKGILKVANKNLKTIYKNTINKLIIQHKKQEESKKSRNEIKKALLQQKSVENVIKNIKQRGQKAYPKALMSKIAKEQFDSEKKRNRNLSIDQTFLMTKSLGQKFLRQREKEGFRLSNLSFINRSQLLSGLERAASSKHHSREVSKNFSIVQVNENFQYLELKDRKQSQLKHIQQFAKPQKQPTIYSRSLHQNKNKRIFNNGLKKKTLVKKFFIRSPNNQYKLQQEKKMDKGYITKLKYFRQMAQLQYLQGCQYSSYFSNLFAPPSAIPYTKNIYKLHY